MNGKSTVRLLGLSFILLCPVQLFASQNSEAVDQYQLLENAVGFHQQFLDDAKAKVGVSAERERALAEFRAAVEAVRKIPKEKLTVQDLKAADEKLASLETFLAPEGLRIAALERAEEMKMLSRPPQSAGTGWQPGASALSFGRFGWTQTDGLLCDTVAFNAIQTTAEQAQLGRIAGADRDVSTLGCDVSFPEVAASLSFGPKGVPQVKARVTAVNWIGKTLALTGPDRKSVGTVQTTLQRPATRFCFAGPAVTCPIRDFVPAKSSLQFQSSKGWQRIALSTATKVDGATLRQSWLLLDLADKEQDQHILVVLQVQKRLKEIEVSAQGLALTTAAGEFGNLWVFRPEGIDRKAAEPTWEKLSRKIDRLCRLNLAWPTACAETFRIDAAAQTVAIRDQVTFEAIKDDWNAEPLADAAIPPLLLLAQFYKAPVKISGNVTDWSIPTKYGPFGTVPGALLEYVIPIPPLYRHGIFTVNGAKDWAELINASAVYIGSPGYGGVDITYRGIASLWPVRGYLAPEKKKLTDNASTAVSDLLSPERFWKRFGWRMEPVTHRRYCFDYPGVPYAGSGVADIDWGNALVLYGLDQWAAYTGKWDELDRAWPQVWAMVHYFVKTHDWAWMADGISEDGQGAAIDCLTAGYAGLVAAARIARTLEKPFEADQATYLAAKSALTHATRFAFLDYIQRHNMWHSDSRGIGTVNGFHEFNTWIHPKHAAPWWGMCSLSGYGVEPECFDALLAYVGPGRVNKWWSMVETMYPEWFNAKKPYPAGTIYGGNSNYVTTPAVYLQFRLGARDGQLQHWIKQAGISDGCFQNPNVFGEIAARDCPVQLADWGRCVLENAQYDPQKKEAAATLTNPTAAPQTVLLVLAGKHAPSQILLDAQPVKPVVAADRWGQSVIRIDVPRGAHHLAMAFHN